MNNMFEGIPNWLKEEIESEPLNWIHLEKETDRLYRAQFCVFPYKNEFGNTYGEALDKLLENKLL